MSPPSSEDAWEIQNRREPDPGEVRRGHFAVPMPALGRRRPLTRARIFAAIADPRVETMLRAALIKRRIAQWIRPRTPPRAIDYDPNDKATCERLAERMFREESDLGAFGSVERGRNLLRIIGDSYPAPPLTQAYFDNLSALLDNRPKLPERGQLLIGLGTGRSGSTTLAALVADVPEACSTHENPPLIFWRPEPEQIEFHIRRFGVLIQYFALVADCAHWWLNAVGDILDAFPDARFIGLVREAAACADSFMTIKKFGLGSYNHWAPFGNDIWIPSHWDPTYPTYDMPSDSQRHPDRSKRSLILRYIYEYNRKLKQLAEARPERYLVLRTEELNMPAALQRIYEMTSRANKNAVKTLALNKGSILDGRNDKLRF